MKKEDELLPIATHKGVVKINDIEITSYVLTDGQRVFNKTQFLRALGRTGSTGSAKLQITNNRFRLPPFLTANNLKPFIHKKLMAVSEPIEFRSNTDSIITGYKAELLPEVCNLFLDAKDAGALTQMQEHIAERCKILSRGFALIGIIALIDEATKYQEVRDKVALQAILDKYLKQEYSKWAKRFPDEFYKQMFRLNAWRYDQMNVKRPGVIGTYTKNIVYKRLAPGIVKELEKLNPKNESGNRPQKHHQYLTESIGHPALQEHLAGIIALMKVSPNWRKFMNLVERVYPKYGDTMPIEFKEEEKK